MNNQNIEKVLSIVEQEEISFKDAENILLILDKNKKVNKLSKCDECYINITQTLKLLTEENIKLQKEINSLNRLIETQLQ